MAIEPVLLLGVSILQYLDGVPDRGALELPRYHVGWNFALNRQIGDALFHPATLSRELGSTHRLVWSSDFHLSFDLFSWTGPSHEAMPSGVGAFGCAEVNARGDFLDQKRRFLSQTRGNAEFFWGSLLRELARFSLFFLNDPSL